MKIKKCEQLGIQIYPCVKQNLSVKAVDDYNRMNYDKVILR